MAGTSDNPIVYPTLEMPDGVDRENVTIWSLGLALDADIYRPTDMASDAAAPGVVLAHGIGGDKRSAERYAARFASAGMVALCFSQPSWGGSQGRLIPVGAVSRPDDGGPFTATVRMVRDLVDPFEWIDAFRSALDYLEGEPGVDPDRMGAWGTSYGAGTALWAAAEDERVKALAVQVPAVFNPPEARYALGRKRAVQIARGEIEPVPQSGDTLPGLPGTPHMARMAQYRVADQAARISVPALILDAENEERYDIAESGGAAHRAIAVRGVDTHYEVFPGIGHYGIYFEGFERSCQMATDWFGRYL